MQRSIEQSVVNVAAIEFTRGNELSERESGAVQRAVSTAGRRTGNGVEFLG